ncbi:MAG: hypothetical protein ABI759_10930 [Candidatus Solibacter sp.]
MPRTWWALLLFIFWCALSSARADVVTVRFCANTRNTDRTVTVNLWLHNVVTGKDTSVGVLNYSQPKTLSVSIDAGNYKIGGFANGRIPIRASDPVGLGSGASFGVGAIVWGDASLPAEITLDRGSCSS